MWVLVAEDEPSMGELLRQGLEEENHTVTLARDGAEALSAATTADFDALVLDVMMPGVDGFDVTRRLRAERNPVPILMLTARDAPSDIVKGLDAGADDYLVKPFALSVLLARLRALTRRSGNAPVEVLELDNLKLDPAARTVTRGERDIALTATEFRVLEFLMRRAGRAASRPAIIESVWGFDEDVELNTIDVYIKSLRDKLDSGRERRLIHTVRGYGYIVRE
ncbi:MAG TPA: response regulator transcription factor [Bryobacteraceae bacterium]|jgi:two-component system response regulator MprA|nr:response regulator transcription factor [Bryobacteraceae bacterium]